MVVLFVAFLVLRRGKDWWGMRPIPEPVLEPMSVPLLGSERVRKRRRRTGGQLGPAGGLWVVRRCMCDKCEESRSVSGSICDECERREVRGVRGVRGVGGE